MECYIIGLRPDEVGIVRRLLARGAAGDAGLDRFERQVADVLIEYLDYRVKAQPGVSPGKEGE